MREQAVVLQIELGGRRIVFVQFLFGAQLLDVRVQRPSLTEVADQQHTRPVDQQVRRFEVAMEDVVGVHVPYAVQQHVGVGDPLALAQAVLVVVDECGQIGWIQREHHVHRRATNEHVQQFGDLNRAEWLC